MTTHIDITCFQSSYQACRRNMLKVAKLASDLPASVHRAFPHPLAGPEGKSLYLDYFYFGKRSVPKWLLVLISGTHGVEGFAGSAIQAHTLPWLLHRLASNDALGIILIHALNPWGFAWGRRYDHENIDLNRNFIDFSGALPDNREYDSLHDALFEQPIRSSNELLSAWQQQVGAQELELILTKGQYQHANGIFFGGTKPSWSHTTLKTICENPALAAAENIAVIDLHTGLGPFGHGEVISDHFVQTAGFDWANRFYGDEVKSVVLGESCSQAKTGLLDYHWYDVLGERGCCVTLEFGTYSLQQLLSLSCDEQRYHNAQQKSEKNRSIHHETVRQFLDFFYPQNPQWQRQVLDRAKYVIDMAIIGMLSCK